MSSRCWAIVFVWIASIAGGLPAMAQASAADRPAAEVPRATLIGHAVLPAMTWSEGPPCGEYDAEGNRFEEPRFPSQPVQGFSSIRWLEKPGRILVLSDNGFGTRANSPDYLLRLYHLRIDPGGVEEDRDSSIEFVDFIQLNDRNRRVPFRIVNETSPERLLTGADFDPESFVVDRDGSLWVGDEFGPFLLHFGIDGTLLEPPYPLEIRESQFLTRVFRSPQNPTLLAQGAAPQVAAQAIVEVSGGIEGLAMSADGTKLLAMLEKVILGDPYRTLRIFEFDLATRSYTGILHLYRLSGDRHRIGELSHLSDTSYVVIERDDADGESARFKRIFRFDLEVVQRIGAVEKTEVVDLLHIRDPDLMASEDGLFRFPFVTIESVEIVDSHTLLVANDNNFDSRGARGEGLLNQNELIWVRVDSPLD